MFLALVVLFILLLAWSGTNVVWSQRNSSVRNRYRIVMQELKALDTADAKRILTRIGE